MCNVNQTWVFYREGITATMMWKRSLRNAPLGSYGTGFAAFAIRVSFSKNGTSTKECISRMEGALDF